MLDVAEHVYIYEQGLQLVQKFYTTYRDNLLKTYSVSTLYIF